MRTTESDNRRLLIITLGLLTLLGTLVIKFFAIQIIEGDFWQKKAIAQHYVVIEEPFKRGKFIASTAPRPHLTQSKPLVLDLQQYQLFADPQVIPEKYKELIALKLNELVAERSLNYFHAQLNYPSRSRRLAIGFSPEDRANLEKWWFPFAKQNKIPRNALYFTPDWTRRYPCGSLLGQVLHTIQSLKDEKTKQAIPTGGLELTMNKFLKGTPGKRRLMRSPRHSFESADLIQPAKNGADVELTIDPYLQAIAEEELERGIKRARAKGGWSVMMNPRTGEILALAQYPFFSPENYVSYFTDPQLIENTRLRAAGDAHEMGSVMKAITLSLALLANKELVESGKKPVFTIDEKVATADSRFPGRTKPLTDTSLHHFLNFKMAIQKSSNIYPARILDRVLKELGNNWYREKLQTNFGFGLNSGIEYPGENPGVVPTPGKKHPNGKLEWSVATPYSLAMGHNIQVNSFQFIRAFAVFANGGHLIRPTLIKTIGGKPLPREAPRQVLPKDIVDQIVDAMKYVTQPGGSGLKANVWGYTEAGKSSTAKKLINGTYSETKYVSSFCGMAPVDNPAFVLLITLDEPHYGFIPGYGRNHMGGNCSAQIFRQMARRSLEYLGVPQDDPYGFPPGDPRRDTTKMVWHKETLLLQEIYQKWNNHKH